MKLRSSSRVIASEKLWYVCFEKSPFWKQQMMSSSVMMAMVVRISKKHRV
jgi:hypothetical protein